MNFDNAHEGIKKLIIAQYLGLFAAAAGLLSIFLTMSMSSALNASAGLKAALGAGGGALVFMLATGGLGIASIVLTIIGLVKAKSDEMNFQTALTFTIAGLGCTIASNLFGNVPVLPGLFNLGSTVCSLFSTIFIVRAIINLSETMGEMGMVKSGQLLCKIIFIAKAAAVGISILTNFFPFLYSINILNFIISTTSVAIEIVVYLLFLRYLIAGRDMLG